MGSNQRYLVAQGYRIRRDVFEISMKYNINIDLLDKMALAQTSLLALEKTL